MAHSQGLDTCTVEHKIKNKPSHGLLLVSGDLLRGRLGPPGGRLHDGAVLGRLRFGRMFCRHRIGMGPCRCCTELGHSRYCAGMGRWRCCTGMGRCSRHWTVLHQSKRFARGYSGQHSFLQQRTLRKVGLECQDPPHSLVF
jgi:hypothetical protein